jgi:hypothetical protein
MNVFDITEVVRLIPDEFSPLKLLQLEMLQKSGTFLEIVARITTNRNISISQSLTMLSKHEQALHQVLAANSELLIQWLDGRSASVLESSNSLLEILYRTDPDCIFDKMRCHLEAATTAPTAFVRLLLDIA